MRLVSLHCSILSSIRTAAWLTPALGALFVTAALFSLAGPDAYSQVDATATKSVLDLSAKSIDGQERALNEFRGKVVMIVNTASKCGFTGQYDDLEKLYGQYKDQGFVVLGFPSNNFNNQEPGTDQEIKQFCSLKYGVTFPMFTKNAVIGVDKQPVYKFLTEQSGKEFQGEIGWNFEKFIVGRDGSVRARFGSFTNPASARVVRKLEAYLAEPANAEVKG